MIDGTHLLDGSGNAARVTTNWKTPDDSNKFFGWIDFSGDPNTIRFDDVVSVIRDIRTGKMVVLLRNCQFAPQISDSDAFRLMRRMGWKSDSVIR